MTNPTAPMIRWDRLVTALDWATTEWLKQQAGKAHGVDISTEWDQTEWMINERRNACGTACCLAGKIVLNAGHRIKYVKYEGEFIIDPNLEDNVSDGNRSFAATAARDIGVDYGYKLDRLFDGHNSIFDLWRISEDISNGIVRMPHWLAQLHIADIRGHHDKALQAFR